MRIRTIKPEWLDDDRLVEAGSDARVLSIALILMADDYGRGRLNHAAAGRVFPLCPENFRESLARLSGWFLSEYEVRGQRYFQIVNWDKHQKVDKPGKPHVPSPEEAEKHEEEQHSRGSREGHGKIIETLALDLDPDLDPDLYPREADDAGKPTGLAEQVNAQLAMEPSSGKAFRLIELLSALHCDVDGRPYVAPWNTCSAADHKHLDAVISLAGVIAAKARISTMSVIAGEWVALIAVVADGTFTPKSPIAFFRSRFGKFGELAHEAAAPSIPARQSEAA